MKINVELDDLVGKQAMQELRMFAANPKVAVQGVLFAVDRKVRDTFQSQSDPWGRAWRPLKEATLEARKRKGGRAARRTSILVATTELFRSLKRYVGAGLSGYIHIGKDDRPVTPHQFGAPSVGIPARPIMPFKSPGSVDMPPEWMEAAYDEIEKNMPEELTRER
jgi:hypothetical protein